MIGNNVRIEQIPDNIVAAIGSFRLFPVFRVTDKNERPTNVRALFRSQSG